MYRGDILAHLPADAGMQLCDRVVSDHAVCAYCEQDAHTVMQGETDSMGYESHYVCDSCLDAYLCARVDELVEVTDRVPKPGHLFVVSGCTNYDIGSRGDWYSTFTSYVEAHRFLQKIKIKAEPWCGLLSNGIEELTLAEVEKELASRRGEMEMLAKEWDEEEAWRGQPRCRPLIFSSSFRS